MPERFHCKPIDVLRRKEQSVYRPVIRSDAIALTGFRSETHLHTLGREIGVRNRGSIGLPNPPIRGMFQDDPRTRESTASRPRAHAHVPFATLSCAGLQAIATKQCPFSIRPPARAVGAAWYPIQRIIRIAGTGRCHSPSHQRRRVCGWKALHASYRDRAEPFPG